MPHRYLLVISFLAGFGIFAFSYALVLSTLKQKMTVIERSLGHASR